MSKVLTHFLAERIKDAWERSRWHSFKGSLQGVTPEMAEWVPGPYRGFPFNRGCILDIAYHVGGDKLVQWSQAFGDKGITWEVVRHRFEEMGGTLESALALGEEGTQKLLETLENLNDEDLAQLRPIWGGRKIRTDAFFVMVIEHDIYHAGQVWYIRCLWEGAHQGLTKGEEKHR